MDSSTVFTHQMLSLARLTPGRRLWALLQMRRVAQARDLRFLISRIDEAIAHDRYTLSVDTTWQATPRNRIYNRRVTELSRLCSRTVTGIRDMALAQAKGRRLGDPHAALVNAFLREVFPGGVGAITSLPYADHVAALEDIIERLRSGQAPMVATLALGRQVDHLAELVAEYRDAIRESLQVVTYEEVHATRQKGQELLSAIVALIMGTYYDLDNRDHVQARAALLGPVLAQDAAIRAYLSSRRAVRDVNPDTGGELDEEVPAASGDAVDGAGTEAGAGGEGSASPEGEPDGPGETGETDSGVGTRRAVVSARKGHAADAGPSEAKAAGTRSRKRRRRRTSGLIAAVPITLGPARVRSSPEISGAPTGAAALSGATAERRSDAPGHEPGPGHLLPPPRGSS